MAYTGTLVRFVASNGFGFIKRDDGEGIAFCHFSQVMNGGSNEMVVGSKMIFDLGVSFRSGRSRARNIIITEHGARARAAPMCEVRWPSGSRVNLDLEAGSAVWEARQRLAARFKKPVHHIQLVDPATHMRLRDGDTLSNEAQLVLSPDHEVEQAAEAELMRATRRGMEVLRAAPTLEVLWTSLAILPESFGQLSSLHTLSLHCNVNLAALPESFGQLPALHTLTLDYNCSLVALPESFGQLRALHTLTLHENDNLVALPESFGQLPALHTLTLTENKNLAALPESFGQLPALHTLALERNVNLVALPESFGQLPALHTLSLVLNPSLVALPESFGQLPALHKLTLYRNRSLTALPEGFGQLPALQELLLDSGFRGDPGLPERMRQLGGSYRGAIQMFFRPP